ncbi:hydrogenase formation protein HypD [Desulfotalea psychrophila]|uniref:Probable hydrogenase accessory protein HypD n=1 Tax=Desulfotalea psychrophila (strain LSv54 / DSM 12343) TaxID=177439 RepID=Q6AQR5_DESPS|nr:hydrogenase formation protein HypD [Desulfotalea psychrophila]CAG35308.1 probable hydrogenase accessory protein HypD [Desulfotalea psychrophila LSv54]
MKHIDEYRDAKLAKPLVAELRRSVTKPLRIMEVCGSHTMSIFRNGIRSILPEGMELLSGPGCPVCVTSAAHMDAFISIAERDGVRVAIFGDLFRVPGSQGSLANASSRGAKVDIVYSPMDALEIAKNNPDELVVFLGVGFETTTPTIAATIMAAKIQKIKNFAVFSTQKTMPAPLIALLQDPELKIDGLLCPGHVSAIIGSEVYEPLARDYNLACVVAGFETADILGSLIQLARQVNAGEFKVENCYNRVVCKDGNPRARAMVERIFEPCDMQWRGLGMIPESGLKIREEYGEFDAERRLEIELTEVAEPKGCLCGEILKGQTIPPRCPLFNKGCTPMNPVGPCMVSSEGTCAAYYKYGQDL